MEFLDLRSLGGLLCCSRFLHAAVKCGEKRFCYSELMYAMGPRMLGVYIVRRDSIRMRWMVRELSGLETALKMQQLFKPAMEALLEKDADKMDFKSIPGNTLSFRNTSKMIRGHSHHYKHWERASDGVFDWLEEMLYILGNLCIVTKRIMSFPVMSDPCITLADIERWKEKTNERMGFWRIEYINKRVKYLQDNSWRNAEDLLWWGSPEAAGAWAD